eukprot:c25195_g6_i2 orf=2341-3330(-)
MIMADNQLLGNTLPEHHFALALLQQLDYAWFQDNLLKPCVGSLMDPLLPSSSSPLSPYQSIELMDAAHSKWASPVSHHPPRREMPCDRFKTSPPPTTRQALASPRVFLEDLSEGTQNKLQSDHQPPQATGLHAVAACPLVSQRHICSIALADSVLVTPGTLQAQVAVRDPKDSQTNENSGAPKLESIESGKQLKASPADTQLSQPALRVLRTQKAQKDPRKSSKSMTALEFDELQGLMDLGFHFGHDDLTPRIMRMVPVIRHKLVEEGDFGRIRKAISMKPKQSSLEAWVVRRSAVPLHDWQTPAAREDMKENLKFWARAVALTVRQEC